MDQNASTNSMGSSQKVTEKHTSVKSIRILSGLVFLGCLLYALIFLYHGVILVLYPFDVDNSEGFLVYQGERLSQGEFLYPPLENPPFLVDNYPPVYPLLLATGFYFTDPNFHWPRLLSLLATCGTALLLGYWTYSRTYSRQAGLLTGLIFLSFYHVYDWGALARVDTTGLLFSIAGLILFEKKRSWKAAFPYFLIALLTRQTLLAAPAAVFCFLLYSKQKKTALHFFITLTGSGILVLLILSAITSGEAFKHLVLYNANTYGFIHLWANLYHWMVFYTVWGCIPLVLLILERSYYRKTGIQSYHANSIPSVLFWYVLFSLFEAALCGKIGSAPNYLLSLVCATAVGAGLLYSRLIELSKKHIIGQTSLVLSALILFLAANLLQLGATIHWPHTRYDWSPTPTREDELYARNVMNKLRRVEGPVLSDRAGIPLMAGHPPVYQTFICTQLALQGQWDQEKLLSRIRKHEFPRIVLLFDLFKPNWDRERFTPEMIDTMRTYYQLARRVQSYFIYIPKK